MVVGHEHVARLGSHLDDRGGLQERLEGGGHLVRLLGKSGVREHEAAAAQRHRGPEEVAEDEGESPRRLEQAGEQLRGFAFDRRDQEPGVEVEALPARGSRLPAGHDLDVRRQAEDASGCRCGRAPPWHPKRTSALRGRDESAGAPRGRAARRGCGPPRPRDRARPRRPARGRGSTRGPVSASSATSRAGPEASSQSHAPGWRAVVPS